jgi:hypothetical protein
MAMQIPKSAILVTIPLTLFAVMVVQRRRSGTATSGTAPKAVPIARNADAKIPFVGAKIPKVGSRAADDGAKATKVTSKVPVMLRPRMGQGESRARKMPFAAAKRHHKPKSRIKYYGIGLLVGALERESTRKAVVGVLKLAQRRV